MLWPLDGSAPISHHLGFRCRRRPCDSVDGGVESTWRGWNGLCQVKKSRRAHPGVVGAASHTTARVSAWGMPGHMGLPHCECESGPEFAARGGGGQASLLSTWPECACGAEVPLLLSSSVCEASHVSVFVNTCSDVHEGIQEWGSDYSCVSMQKPTCGQCAHTHPCAFLGTCVCTFVCAGVRVCVSGDTHSLNGQECT